MLSEPLIGELRQVLAHRNIRTRLDAQATDAGLFLDLLPFFIAVVDLTVVDVPLPRDADDRAVLATFVASEADWLISGDEDLLVLADRLPKLAPAAFVDRFLLKQVTDARTSATRCDKPSGLQGRFDR